MIKLVTESLTGWILTTTQYQNIYEKYSVQENDLTWSVHVWKQLFSISALLRSLIRIFPLLISINQSIILYFITFNVSKLRNILMDDQKSKTIKDRTFLPFLPNRHLYFLRVCILFGQQVKCLLLGVKSVNPWSWTITHTHSYREINLHQQLFFPLSLFCVCSCLEIR